MIKMERILCPIDFSESSRRAFDYAVPIARWYGSTITALHVFWIAPVLEAAPYVGTGALQPIMLTDVDREELRAEMRRFLGADKAGVPVDIRLSEAYDVHHEILSQTVETAADLLVIGTHGRSGFRRLVLGSITEKVLRTVSCPTLTVPPGAPDAVPVAQPLFTRILCAVDFSDCSTAALRYACSLAQEADAELDVLHVVARLPELHEPVPLPLNVPAYQAALEASSLARLSAAVPKAVREYCTVHEILRTGTPHREILNVANQRQADVVVVGAHGSGVIDRMLFGSTTERLVRQATCPVLTVRV